MRLARASSVHARCCQQPTSLLGSGFHSIVGLTLPELALVGAKEFEDLFGQRLDLLGGSELRGRVVLLDAIHLVHHPAQSLPCRAQRGIVTAEALQCLPHSVARWQQRRPLPELLIQPVLEHHRVPGAGGVIWKRERG